MRGVVAEITVFSSITKSSQIMPTNRASFLYMSLLCQWLTFQSSILTILVFGVFINVITIVVMMIIIVIENIHTHVNSIVVFNVSISNDTAVAIITIDVVDDAIGIAMVLVAIGVVGVTCEALDCTKRRSLRSRRSM